MYIHLPEAVNEAPTAISNSAILVCPALAAQCNGVSCYGRQTLIHTRYVTYGFVNYLIGPYFSVCSIFQPAYRDLSTIFNFKSLLTAILLS